MKVIFTAAEVRELYDWMTKIETNEVTIDKRLLETNDTFLMDEDDVQELNFN